jgi:hypothetical protein
MKLATAEELSAAENRQYLRTPNYWTFLAVCAAAT